ncbi:hypothetical protein BCD96_005936, partial [Clostridium beijerinckii]|nr:hypothetical protein [Clostridium beijerinckii]
MKRLLKLPILSLLGLFLIGSTPTLA